MRSQRAVRRLVEMQREEKKSFKGAQGAQLTLPAQPRVLLLYLGRSAATHVCDLLHLLSFFFWTTGLLLRSMKTEGGCFYASAPLCTATWRRPTGCLILTGLFPPKEPYTYK